MSTATTTQPFLAACKSQPTAHTPVWIMRQAGRYLPEYRAVREKVDFLTLCSTPDLAAEVTLQPIRRFNLDAAILFADIMTPLSGMGVPIAFSPGPVVAEPIRSAKQVADLRALEPEADVPYVLETVRILRRELPTRAPLIGFAGAPFTLFCYLVEGQGSRTFTTAKRFLFSEPEAALALLHKLGDAMAAYLCAQAKAGAQALMLFDSWVGLLAPADFERFVTPVLERVLAKLPSDIPHIYFPNHGATLLPQVSKLPVDVVGIDWRTPLSHARKVLGPNKAVQGNLDPALLFAPMDELTRRIEEVVHEAGSAPGHIFNLGHGIDRHTDLEAVAHLVDTVHKLTRTNT